jgi:hypothetical protein
VYGAHPPVTVASMAAFSPQMPWIGSSEMTSGSGSMTSYVWPVVQPLSSVTTTV